jgi:hypothetical protein
MIQDAEARFRRMERSILFALLAIGVGALATSALATARHVGADLGAWNGLLVVLQVVGYLLFGVLMVGGWIAGRRFDPDERSRFSDELAEMVSARSVRIALLVTVVLSAILMSLDIDWPGQAAAGVVYAAAVITLAVVRLRSEP